MLILNHLFFNEESKHDKIRQKNRVYVAEVNWPTFAHQLPRMWEEQTAGEDLVALLQTPGHGTIGF